MPSPEAALRDPMLARRLSVAMGHGVSPVVKTIGRFAVWCSDVEDLKTRIDPSMTATDKAVTLCTSFPAASRAAWAEFFEGWKKFRATSCLVFGAGAQYDEADAWRVQLGQWQELLGKSCTLGIPQVSTEPEGALLASSIKWIAVAAIAGAVVYGVHAVIK